MARLALLTVTLLLSPLPPALASTVSITATPGKSLAPTAEPARTPCATPGTAECTVVDDEADQAGGEDQDNGDSGE